MACLSLLSTCGFRGSEIESVRADINNTKRSTDQTINDNTCAFSITASDQRRHLGRFVGENGKTTL